MPTGKQRARRLGGGAGQRFHPKRMIKPGRKPHGVNVVQVEPVLPRSSPEVMETFIFDQLDRAGLGHNTFTQEALSLIVRSGEGLLRRYPQLRNLCLGSLIEAVRDQTRTVDLKQVNRVLTQPHWRKDCDSCWRRPQRNMAGNTIDFFVQVLGLSFHNAMREIYPVR